MRVLRLLNLAVAAGLLAAGIAAWGGMVDARLDILTHFALPFLALALVSVCLAWAGARRRVTAELLTALVATALWLALTGPELAARLMPRSAPAGEAQLRVMEFNIYRHNSDPRKAALAIRESGADVVLAIEAIGTSRYIPRAVRDVYPYRVRCACDMTILSRWPIVDDSVTQDTRPGGQAEPSMLWAVVRTPSGDVPVMGAHYRWPTQPAAQRSLRRALAWQMTSMDRKSLILMGDFNSTAWSFFMRRQDEVFDLERRTRGLPTWPAQMTPWPRIPAPMPLLPIDHVYAGSAWRTLSVERGPRAGSDHYPVIVTLARKAG